MAKWEKQVDVGAVREVRFRNETKMEFVADEVVGDPNLDKEVSNFQKDISEPWDQVVFRVYDDEIKNKLNALLPDSDDRVPIRLLEEFL